MYILINAISFIGYSQLEYYVTVNGDNFSGDINHPFKTIYKVSQVALPGDIIKV